MKSENFEVDVYYKDDDFMVGKDCETDKVECYRSFDYNQDWWIDIKFSVLPEHIYQELDEDIKQETIKEMI